MSLAIVQVGNDAFWTRNMMMKIEILLRYVLKIQSIEIDFGFNLGVIK